MSNLFCVSLVIVLVITVVSCDKNTGNTDQNTEPTNALEKYSSTFGKKINSRTREAPNRENKAKVMPSVVPIETPKRDKNRSRQRSSNQSTTPTAPARSSIPTPKPIKSRNSATESTGTYLMVIEVYEYYNKVYITQQCDNCCKILVNPYFSFAVIQSCVFRNLFLCLQQWAVVIKC